jgi:hypothetical protein
MKGLIRTSLALCCLLCSGAAFAAAHTLSYSKISRPADTVISIGGESHTMVAIPVRTLVSGDKYTIVFPAPTDLAGSTFGIVSTIHNPDAFTANMTIDSFPAQVQVSDGLNYILNGDAVSGYDFIVTGDATVTVSIDLGDTILSLSDTLTAKDPVSHLPFLTNATIPNANAVSSAENSKYVDKTALTDGLDKWLDYIRIIPR